MISRELVYQALAFQEVPRVPYAVGFTIPARQRFCADPTGRELFEQIDNDLHVSPVIRIEYGVRDPDGRYTDEFGVVWDRSADPDIGVSIPSLTPENFDSYPWPDPNAPGRFDRLQAALRQHPDKFQVMAVDFSLYERAWTLRGLTELLLDFIENPGFAEALLDRVLQFNLDVIDAALRLCPQIDAVYFGDDFGSQTGLIMGAQRWRQFLRPRLARQYSAVHQAGKKVLIHSCGRVQEIFDDLADIGVDCFNPFQPEVMDVYAIHRQYHGRLAFWGGISTQQLLPYGTVQQVETEVDKLLALGRSGGYIIAPCHNIQANTPPENIVAMYETGYEYGWQ